MPKIQDIIAKIASKKEEMEALVAGLEENERSAFNKEEQEQFDALADEIKALEQTRKSLNFMDSVDPGDAPAVAPAVHTNKTPDTEEGLRKRFSICQALQVVTGEGYDKRNNDYGLIEELDQEGKREMRSFGQAPGDGGVTIPAFLMRKNPMTAEEARWRAEASREDYEKALLEEQKRDLVVGTPTAGGHNVATLTRPYIEYLNPDLVVERAGARMLTGLTSDVKFPRNDGVGTIAWEGETDATAETTQSFDSFTLQPKRAAAYTDISKQLIIQGGSNFDAEMFVRMDLTEQTAQAVEQVIFEGNTGNEPTGITTTSGIGDVALGTNGAALSWSKIVEFMTDLSGANAYKGKLAWFFTPEAIGQMMTTPKESGYPVYLIQEPGNSLLGQPVYWSNNLPKDLTKGTGTALHAGIFGNVDDLIVAQFGGLDIINDIYTQATSGIVRVVINTYWDVALRHPESFTAALDIDVTA